MRFGSKKHAMKIATALVEVWQDIARSVAARGMIDRQEQAAVAHELSLLGWTCTPPADEPQKPKARRAA